MTLQDTYLAWDALDHSSDCSRPEWTVDVRTDHDAFRARQAGLAHSCPTEGCDHSDRYDRTSIRIVCRSCGRAQIFTGDAESRQSTCTAALGYGQQPRKAAGLFLYPGEPLLFGWGNPTDNDPTGYLVTRKAVDRVQADDLVGQIAQERGSRGAIRWTALAGPAADGPYGYGRVRWSQASEEMRSVAAAAKWIAACLITTGGDSV
ncbi:hypothetical protein [Streptomyces sp. NPDC056707]|uniref:hypothetical protein n=1 Tax=Streptomyces sp. NPDC056707 TaxID=3345919 RepID=UPI0036B08F83